ncbi:hypothetical protein M0R45_008718 [Rubus argutus]|uniref:RNase H type-1 domain-containing protein n=1 Tax=Rubus argutus TaxID=59490 RepID=A0AAW1Y2J3_RUBAR
MPAKQDTGSTPSYAWHSILYGRDVLHSGIHHHIGDGRSTNVWTDPWLPRVDLSSYSNPRVNLVFDLISTPGTWDISLVSELFPLDLVNKISSIPLSFNSHVNRWIWGADRRAKHELLALLVGVQEACNRHLVPLIVESDCLNIVQAVHSDSLDFSDLGFLLADLCQLLSAASACFFDSCSPLCQCSGTTS